MRMLLALVACRLYLLGIFWRRVIMGLSDEGGGRCHIVATNKGKNNE